MQKLNFLSLARHCLWIFGNVDTLTNTRSVWKALICDAKARGCFFSADEDADVSNTILDVKKELDQMEDLLIGDSTLFKQQRWTVMFSCLLLYGINLGNIPGSILVHTGIICPSRKL